MVRLSLVGSDSGASVRPSTAGDVCALADGADALFCAAVVPCLAFDTGTNGWEVVKDGVVKPSAAESVSPIVTSASRVPVWAPAAEPCEPDVEASAALVADAWVKASSMADVWEDGPAGLVTALDPESPVVLGESCSKCDAVPATVVDGPEA